MALREVLLVVQKGDHSLGYYDFETGQEVGRVAVDPFPHEFALSADRRRRSPSATTRRARRRF